MTGRKTIENMLQCHFRIPVYKMHRLDTICDFLLNRLEDPDHEKRLNIKEMREHIDILARLFSANNQHDLATIQGDLWELLTNWWNAVKWARREIRAPMEQANLLGDLLSNIVRQIYTYFGEDGMKQHYTPLVLQALMELDTKVNDNDPYMKQKQELIAENLDPNNFLPYYQQLSRRYGFDNRTNVLLQLLLDKKERNDKIHSDHKVREYRQCCADNEVQPSFDSYIAFRGLDIDPQLLDDYRRLFEIKYNFD